MKRKSLLLSLFLCATIAAKAQVTSFNIDTSKFNKVLAKQLDSIYKEDQDTRMAYIKLVNAKQQNSPEGKAATAKMKATDSLNQLFVEGILSKYGWLAPQDVGMYGSQALFLVIQHANLPMQEKYLPMIRKAEKDGRILSSNLAILEDRVALRQGKKQIYGSQIKSDAKTGEKSLFPLDDPDHVDERRKAMGLQPLAEYLEKSFQMKWDVEAYKKANGN
ncbi:DUF6624 domain-containing protein [Pedobacter sp. KR3-3]|uniref:DUF6624 domain-containing protein n=1 Tax=Pedobacter albus TaxID=3113905 RepID=A0ABU7I7H5_9SPHI|nr:DUF6624 domain-containing protein [Pedobacter sp. KR3-3]MEE1945410.1 DUF6624 domain-containing protein [Pedobacter sp. KR3-3]